MCEEISGMAVLFGYIVSEIASNSMSHAKLESTECVMLLVYLACA